MNEQAKQYLKDIENKNYKNTMKSKTSYMLIKQKPAQTSELLQRKISII